jgi:hypothetical protein
MGATFSTDLKRCSRYLLPETHETMVLDAEGACNMCRDKEAKAELNWRQRIEELDARVAEYRGSNRFDCLVPLSGGKDSTWMLYYMKKRYPRFKPVVVRSSFVSPCSINVATENNIRDIFTREIQEIAHPRHGDPPSLLKEVIAKRAKGGFVERTPLKIPVLTYH